MTRKLGVTLGETPIIVTGATGRVGRLLRLAWSDAPGQGLVVKWAGRSQDVDIAWSIESDHAPALPEGAVVVHLAGVVRADPAEMGRNALLARKVAEACAANGARALIAASTAAVYRPSPDLATEDTPPDPQSAYGRAKADAEATLTAISRDLALPVTHLRIANILGADALIGLRAPDASPCILDPVPGRAGGPLRSWIGPVTFADALARLCRIAAEGRLPEILNLAQQPPLCMADLLEEARIPWSYGPANPNVVPTAALCTQRLERLFPLPPASPRGLVDELRRLRPGLLP